MNQAVMIWAGIKAVGLYYLIQGVLGLLSGFVVAVGNGSLADIGAVVWWSNIVSAAIGAYLVMEALVHGSGFPCIMLVKPRSGVGTDEVSETQPVQAREIPLPDTQLA